MAKKVYRTYHLKSLVIHAKGEDGERIDIPFHGGAQIDSTAKFSTADPDLQDILESCSRFGKDYYIESVVENKKKEEKKAPEAPAPEPKEEKVLVDMKDVRRFRNLVEMKAALKEAGLKIEDSWNYSQTKKFATENGYDYKVSKAEK